MRSNDYNRQLLAQHGPIKPALVDIEHGLDDSYLDRINDQGGPVGIVTQTLVEMCVDAGNEWAPFTWEQYCAFAGIDCLEQKEMLSDLVEGDYLLRVANVYSFQSPWFLAMDEFIRF
ncbi:MAG: hypothetical protein AAF564_17755 [Bacteroidota bacterium]